MEAIETFDHAGLKVSIYPDDDHESPRDWCNVGEMVHWHRRYELGDRSIEGNEDEAMRRGGFRLLERYLHLACDAAIVIPLGLLDHSGLHIWAGGGSHWSDSAGWDSGTVGFIWATKDKVKEEWGDEPDALNLAEAYLREEVKTYDQYLQGDIYGYVIDDAGEYEDSCWGFFGLDYAIQQAKEVAEFQARQRDLDVEPDVDSAIYKETR